MSPWDLFPDALAGDFSGQLIKELQHVDKSKASGKTRCTCIIPVHLELLVHVLEMAKLTGLTPPRCQHSHSTYLSRYIYIHHFYYLFISESISILRLRSAMLDTRLELLKCPKIHL